MCTYIYIFTRTSKVSETQVSLPYLQFSLVRLVSKYLQRTPPWVAAGWGSINTLNTYKTRCVAVTQGLSFKVSVFFLGHQAWCGGRKQHGQLAHGRMRILGTYSKTNCKTDQKTIPKKLYSPTKSTNHSEMRLPF